MAIEQNRHINQEIVTGVERPMNQKPLAYDEIIQRPDVRAAKTLQEQDVLILEIYRQSRDAFEKKTANNLWAERESNPHGL
jgi:hypothetical protein